MSDSARGLKRGFAVAGTSVLISLGAALPASAQNASCSEIEKSLTERKDIIQKIESYQTAKKKPTAQEACGVFTKLVNNGSAGLKWLAANKDWCSIPDAFVERYKDDHAKMIDVRGKACSVAAKAEAMQKAQAASPKNQLFGGPGLSGTFKMPQGAM